LATSLPTTYASNEVSRVHVSGMHGSKANRIDGDDFVAHYELKCPSSLKKVHSNLKKIGSHRILKSKGFMSQVVFTSFKF
jgi:hypothetical protein